MNWLLGSAGVYLGLASSVLGGVSTVIALRRRDAWYVRVARVYAWLILAAAVLAVFAMQRALLTNDFSIAFLQANHSTRTPFPFNVATMWAALEGSILLWALVLAGYVAVVVHKFRDRLSDPLFAWALLVLFVVCAFFFGLMATEANPFVRAAIPANLGEGPGPNPLLQNNVLMAFHPPMLYLGYVGFTVPFAFAIAALVTGRVGEGWLIATRRWTLFAWGFLTVGIILGAWWAYEVLGWGGYWGWDPVENASFLPWLTGTAYLHSVMVQERRGMLRVWNLSLVCATFALTILGTFLTRSGVINSVHAFSSGIGPILLAFFAVIVAVTIGLIAWRGDRLRAPGRIDSPLSREGAFLANNVLFGAFAFVVLLGTVFPLLIEAINDERITVGAPYFERMSAPIGFTLLFLMAVAPVLPWRKASGELLRERLLWPAWIATATVVVAVALGGRGIMPLVAFGLAGFGAGSAGRQLVLAIRRQAWRGLVGRTNGGMVVHLGVVVMAVALAGSSAYVRQSELTLTEGQTATVGSHTVQYLRAAERDEGNRIVTEAQVLIDGQPYAPMLERFDRGDIVGKPTVRTTPVDDVMVSLLSQPDTAKAVRLRIITQPFVVWLWIGGALMAVGTALAVIPNRGTRTPTDPVSARPAAAGGRDDDDDAAVTSAEPAEHEPVAVP